VELLPSEVNEMKLVGKKIMAIIEVGEEDLEVGEEDLAIIIRILQEHYNVLENDGKDEPRIGNLIDEFTPIYNGIKNK